MGEFTKGEWKLQGSTVLSQDAETVICELSEMYTQYAQHESLSIGSPNWREAMANGRLIENAPKLYEALKRLAGGCLHLIEMGEFSQDGPFADAVEQAQAALDAAGGER